MKRTAIKLKPPRNPGFSRQTKNDALRRSGGRCEMITPVCTGSVERYHHVFMRSAGVNNTLGNCCACCEACHTYAHTHRREAREHGWISSRFSCG